MTESAPKRPHRRGYSVPVPINFRITPLTTIQSLNTITPTFGTSALLANKTHNGALHLQKRPSRRSAPSSGAHTPTLHATGSAYEDHPPADLKRSSSTFFLSSLPAYQRDWKYLHGARVAAESLEQEGRSWLVTRASSTDLVAQGHLDLDGEDTIYHRHTKELEILELGERFFAENEEEHDPNEEFNWSSWIQAFLESGEESDDDTEVEWKPVRRRIVAFEDVPERGSDVSDEIARRARERDEEHGLDGWMDGAAYLAFLGVRALGGMF
jgi:Protein of unknown function (DUF3984)